MNIKTMMAALACAATVGFSASAGTTQWFNGGLTADWPNAAGMNAKWSGDSTNTSSFADSKLSIVLDDNKDPLVLTADSTKGVGTEVDSATFTIEAGFSAYDEVPGVPTDAKAGVTFVSTNDNDTAGVFYYLAYDSTSGVESNVWVATEVSANITGDFSAAQGIEVTLAPGETGFWAVTYKFKGDYPTTINTTVKKDGSSSEYAGVIEFSGNGPGYATAISAEYADKTYAVTIDDASLATKGLVATNVTVNGQSSYKAAAGDTVIVWFKPVDGMKFKGSATSYQFTMGSAAVTINATTEGLPETESANVSMYFVDYGGNQIAGAQKSYSGVPNSWFTASNEVLNAAASFEAQIPGTWWDGTWSDGSDPVAFPVKFPEESGNEYKMIATNIIYTVGTVDAGTEVYVTFDGEGVTEYEVDSGYEGDVVEVSADPTSDPTGAGRTFLGWTCAYFNITTPTKLADMAALTMPESFNTWEDLGDIIFVANWEEASKPVEPGNDGTTVTPNPEDGSVTIEENTTNPGQATITLNDTTTTIKVTSTIDTLTVNGKTPAAGQIVVLSSNGADITAACKMTTTGSTIDLSLNPNAYVGDVKVQPTVVEAESTEGTIADGAVATAAIPGLTYELKRGTELGDYSTIEGATTAKKTATGSSVTLKDDTTKPTTKAFYVIEVTK